MSGNVKSHDIRKKIVRFNEWKIAFLVLLGVIIGTLLFVGFRITENREPVINDTATIAKNGDTLATFTTNKAKINKIINTFLADYQTKKLNYQFYLDDQVVLEGRYQFLGIEVPLFIYFEPYKLENGNIQLKVKSVSAGTLSLPTSAVLSFVSKEYAVPQFVKIDAKQNYIELRLNQLNLGKNLYIKTKRIDTMNDEFSFDLYQGD